MKKIIPILALFLCAFVNAKPDWAKLKQQVMVDVSKLQGWCSNEKIEKMMDLIYETQPQVCVEIGVYGGSSILPTAKALSYVGGEGKVFAIDPWTKAASIVGFDQQNINYRWWNNLDIERILHGFMKMLMVQKIQSRCAVLRMTSEEANSWFDDESIDVLHIDGNHSEVSSMADVTMYLPKVKQGGYIWFDDADWETTQSAVQYLMSHCDMLLEKSVGNQCLLFQKR